MRLVLKEDQFKKLVLTVAAAAVLTKAAIVYVLPRMTVTTDGRCFTRIRPRRMTCLTGDTFVRTKKRITRVLLVIELPQVPGIWRVAALALVTQCPLMMVVRLMATGTGAIRASKLVTEVAVLAGNHAMQADQRELGKVMVETIDRIPAIGDMAGGAGLHIRIFVWIVSGVTTGAIARQFILQGAHVAAGTRQFLMLAQKGKSHLLGMVELGFFPLYWRMAAVALLAVAAQMDIVVRMAAVTGQRVIALHHPVAVAGATRQFAVTMHQGKVCGVVIENEVIPAIHRMAGIALLAILARMHVRCLVAAHTGGFLKLVPLAYMATAAGDFLV